MVSKIARVEELGGGLPETVADVFFNELTKRELGRIKCLEVGCTHYLNMMLMNIIWRTK